MRIKPNHLAEIALRFVQAAVGEGVLSALKQLRGIGGLASLTSEGDEFMGAPALPFPGDVGEARGGGIAIAISASRSKTKPSDGRALDTGMGLCCSVRQCTLSIQASDANIEERLVVEDSRPRLSGRAPLDYFGGCSPFD